MADQTGITNLLTSGKAVQAGNKGAAKGKLHDEARAEDQFSALLSRGQKTKTAAVNDEAEPTAKVASHDDGKKPVGTDRDMKIETRVAVVHAEDAPVPDEEPIRTASEPRPDVKDAGPAAVTDSVTDSLGDVLALLAGTSDPVQAPTAPEVDGGMEIEGEPDAQQPVLHTSHERKAVHPDPEPGNGVDRKPVEKVDREPVGRTDREPHAGEDPQVLRDARVAMVDNKSERTADPVTAPVVPVRTDDAVNLSQTNQDNRLPLQMAAVLGFGMQKQALAETRDDAIIIRATRADGKGIAETRKLGGERMETDATDRQQPVRAMPMPGQTEQRTIDLLSPDKDIKPVTAKSAKADNADMAAARLVDVQVLEARRFVGLADSSNVSRLGQAIVDDISAIRSKADVPGLNDLAGNVTSVVHTLKLQMHPDNLGPMTASLRLKGEELSVDVRVETVEAYRQLTADQDNLVKSLKDQGFAVEQVNIQLAPSASADSGSNAGSQQNPNFGNPGRDQSMTGQGQQGQMPGQGRGNQSGHEQGRQDARKPIIDANETARNPAGSAGQLYL